MIPLTRPYFSLNKASKISKAVESILLSGNLMMGQWTNKFELDFSKKIGTKYSLTTNTCTTALQIALQFFSIKGCEVLVPSGSFQTNISTIKWAGGKPVLVDMNPETLSFCLDDLQRKLTNKTKGIVWVHVTGIISKEYKKIVKFAKKNNLFLIEDCAHAHGSSIDNIQAGKIGDVGCFSFYPSKVMTTGTGGMLVTDNKKLAEFTMKMRLLGRNLKGGGVSLEGNDWFMDEIRACVGYHQLLDLDKHIKKRAKIAKKYDRGFSKNNMITLLEVPENCTNSYYQYALLLNKNIDRDTLIKTLKLKYNIATKRIWLPTHQENIFKNLKFDKKTLSKTENTFNRSLCIPIYYDLSKDEVERVIFAISTELNFR